MTRNLTLADSPFGPAQDLTCAFTTGAIAEREGVGQIGLGVEAVEELLKLEIGPNDCPTKRSDFAGELF